MPHEPVFVPASYFCELTLDEVFSDAHKPLEVDLGCGDGRFLEAMSAHFPERNFLGVERLLGRVGKTARRIRERNLTNARVLRLESAYVVAWLLPARSVSRLHLLCPDPWPKKKHHGRRLFNDEEFFTGLERALEIDGEFLLKSDDAEYFEAAVQAMSARAAFERVEWPEDAFFYATTSFEQQWLAQGKTINRARWRLRQLAV